MKKNVTSEHKPKYLIDISSHTFLLSQVNVLEIFAKFGTFLEEPVALFCEP